MPWHLEGTYFENCSCEMVCPCTTSGGTRPADYERCRVVMAFHIDRGHVEALDVSGVTVVVVIDTPQLMADGGWRVGLIIEDTATAEQASSLASVFSGQRGGPMALLAPLFSEMLGVESAPIEYVDDGRRHTVKVGDTIDVEIEDYVAPGNPTDEIERLSGMLHPASSTLTIARATRSHVEAFGLSFSALDKSGHFSPFSWDS